MANWTQAKKWLSEGRKVRLGSWRASTMYVYQSGSFKIGLSGKPHYLFSWEKMDHTAPGEWRLVRPYLYYSWELV